MTTRAAHDSHIRNQQFSTLSCLIVLTVVIVCGTSPSHGQGNNAPVADPDYAAGEILIKFKAGAGNAQVLDAFHRGRLDKVKRTFKLKGGNHPGLHQITTKLEVPAAVLALSKHPAVEYAEPNYKVYPSAIPNDPQYSQLWGMAKISAPAAWNTTTGSSTVLVGVLDTGIDFNHPDLAANIWNNPNETPGDGIDNDNNGYIDDVRGWDWWYGDNSVYDPGEAAHGTHVAGTIGAAGNNGTGVAGVNWQVKIVPLKFIGPQFGSNAGAIAGIEYAAAQGVKVINGSFGSGWHSQGVKDALDAAGILFVAAAGNNSTNTDVTPFYPADFNLGHVISVAATTSNDGLASFSNYGATSVDLGAPGEGILSTFFNGGYGTLSGTSMAAPHVTGVAALIYSLNSTLNAAEVKYRILSSTDPIAALAGKSVTGGRLNAARALLPPVPSSNIAADGFESGTFTGGTGSWAGGWTATGDLGIQTSSGPAEGSRHVRMRRNTGYLRRAANTGAASSLQLRFRAKVESFEGSDRADVFVSNNGTTWIPAEQFTAADSDGAWHEYEIDVTSLLPSAQIHIAFDAGMDANNDNWYLDDIRLTGPQGNLPPVADAGPDKVRSDTDGNGSEIFTLNSSNSFDPDGTIVSYEWTHDGMPIGTTPVIEVEVLEGTWTVTLTVTDDDGAVHSDTVQITVHGHPITVFTESFERTSLSPWTQDSQKDWAISTQNAVDGTRAAEVDGAASDAMLISPLIDLQGRIMATITFDWLIEGSLDNGEYLMCELSQDGGAAWTGITARIDGNVGPEDTWVHVDSGPCSMPNGTLRFRFRGKMSASDEDAFVDNIRVVAGESLP